MGTTELLGKLIPSCFGLLILACDPDHNIQPIDFVIINESGVPIQLVPRPPQEGGFTGNRLRSPIVLNQNEAFSEVLEISTDDGAFDFFSFFQTNILDIYFDAERQQRFTCFFGTSPDNCSDPRNILTFSADDENRSEYTFTPTDFENAEPCHGPCNE